MAIALKRGEPVAPEKFDHVTIYFADIIGFTTIAAHSEPLQIVGLLNELYSGFDDIVDSYHIYKVETIGDSYMVASGIPDRNPDHAQQIADMSLDILHFVGKFRIKHMPYIPLMLRIGVHTGEAIAGVVGNTRPRYCLFGDAVNVASRMESTGRAQRVHITEDTERHLRARTDDLYTLEYRGEIDLRGKGVMKTFWLNGKKGFDKELPKPPEYRDGNHGMDSQFIHEIIKRKCPKLGN